MIIALIENGIVTQIRRGHVPGMGGIVLWQPFVPIEGAEIAEPVEGQEPAPVEMVPAPTTDGWREVPPEVVPGYVLDGDSLVLPTPDPAEVQAAREAGVKVERRRRLDAGREFPVPGLTDPVHMTGRAQDEVVILGLMQRAMALKGAGVTVPAITYRDGQNVVHQFTPDQWIALATAGMNWVEAVMAASWTLIDSGAISEDFADDAHWPE